MPTNDAKAAQIHLVDVVRHGEKIIIPERLSYSEAIVTLGRMEKLEQEEVAILETVDAYPWDGALALARQMDAVFGVVFAQREVSFFMDEPPREMSVETAFGETKLVRWGKFKLPGEGGFIWTDSSFQEGSWKFIIGAKVKRKYIQMVRDLVAQVRQDVAKNSIYKGKAFRINFDDGEEMPTPRFLDLTKANHNDLVFSRDLEQLIAVNLHTPIQHAPSCRALRIPIKRGILLSGPYGTGKTLLAYQTAAKAVASGFTFIYLANVANLAEAISFAKRYSPSVIFAEDVDRAVTGERSSDMDSILNTLDGIDSKDTEIMVVLTTNHLENIHQALLRPGRLDCILNIAPPDAEAHVRLIRLYGRGTVKDTDDALLPVGQLLAKQGVIPAVTREVVERAKLGFIERDPVAAKAGKVTLIASDLFYAAKTMEQQNELLLPKSNDEPTTAELFGTAVGKEVARGLKLSMHQVERGADLETALSN